MPRAPVSCLRKEACCAPGVGAPDPGGRTPTPRPPAPGGGLPTCAAVAVLLALAVQQQREPHQQDDQQTGECHHQEEPPLLVERRLHLSCRETDARSRGRKLCACRGREGPCLVRVVLGGSTGFPEKRLRGRWLSPAGVLSPPLPPPPALASELTFSQFHLLSGLWGGRNRSARTCSSLPGWGLSPQTPQIPRPPPSPLPPGALLNP